MHPIISKAARVTDQAELYWNRTNSVEVRYEDCRLQEVKEAKLSEAALRVIANGKMGSAYAVFPDQPDFLDNAVTGAEFGDPVGYSFAGPATYPQLDNYEPVTADLTSADLIDICETIKAKLESQLPDVALGISASRHLTDLAIQTTRGAKASARSSRLSYSFSAPFKGAGISLYDFRSSVGAPVISDEMVEQFVTWYRRGNQTSTPRTGRLPVILAPHVMFLMLMPLLAGVNGEAIWKGTSPLVDRLGEKILSDKLTIHDDPLLASSTDARAFDDEGIACAKHTIVDQGILKDYVVDQRVGAALNRPSTGNGFKRALFGGGNETAITPWFCCPTVEPGDVSWHEMVKDLKEGLLITDSMGFHSANYAQGNFAVQAVGFHIVNGAVVGRLDKTMISGNIYDDCQHIAAVSRELGPGSGFLPLGQAPYLMIDSLQVAGT